MRFVSVKGKLSEVVAIRMELGEPDASGRRRPMPVEGSEFSIPVDGVLASIGQEPDLECLDDTCRLDVGKKNCLAADPVTLQTSIPDIFAGGDAVLGPATVVQAIGQGKEAAESIRRFIDGEDLAAGRGEKLTPVAPLSLDVPHREREKPAHADPKERRKDFSEVLGPLSEEQAKAEAGRCLACAGCAECLLSAWTPAWPRPSTTSRRGLSARLRWAR